jgi:hypothetical protein
MSDINNDIVTKEDYLHEASDDSYSNFSSYIIVAITTVCVIVISFYTYKYFSSDSEEGSLEVVKAQTEEVTKLPENPGGIQVPNLDKSIYDSFGNQKEAHAATENVLPSSEPEMTHDEIIALAKKMQEAAFPSQNQDNAKLAFNEQQPIQENPQTELAREALEDAHNQITQESVALQPKDPFVENNIKEPEFVPATPLKKVSVKPPVKLEKTSVDDFAKTPRKFKKNVPSNNAEIKKQRQDILSGYRIQIASLRSEATAIEEWKKIKARYPELLNNYKALVEKRDLEEKGVVYRLQVGIFKSESDGRNLCKKLQENGQGCFLVK